ncbi:helix-turn-helix domain-containing protein [Streptomyces asoensis]|uniref:helix-turn-helix domain-containing protein n=1 Tax=Streptomyces asoensis TaxID=249586 RepID=UPI0033E99081
MPRWRALPDGLDPRVAEFVEQLRRTVERAGLGVAELAERTGYGRSSWERYLDGRLLAPKGAVVALAEVTGTPVDRLTTMWELAERARNRAGARHERPTEAVGVTPGRAASGEFGPPPGEPRSAGRGRGGREGGSGPGAGRTPMLLAGLVGVAVVVGGAFLLGGGEGPQRTGGGAPSSPAPAGPSAPPPSGVLCAGSACTGLDAEDTGCGDSHAVTAKTATVGTTVVEVRYSGTCGAAWGRITGAVRGDTVRVTVGSVRETGTVTAASDTLAYTPMVAVRAAADATACAVLASGEQGCTP